MKKIKATFPNSTDAAIYWQEHRFAWPDCVLIGPVIFFHGAEKDLTRLFGRLWRSGLSVDWVQTGL